MKCWFRPETEKEDAEWTQGWIFHGAPREVLTLGSGKGGCDHTILEAAYHYDIRSLRVTGYRAERDGSGDFVFRQSSWEVVFSKPRVKKGTSK
jgi:hypothetical protein